jgi:hypothetical protein
MFGRTPEADEVPPEQATIPDIVAATPVQALAAELADPGRVTQANPGASGHHYYLTDSVVAEFLASL